MAVMNRRIVVVISTVVLSLCTGWSAHAANVEYTVSDPFVSDSGGTLLPVDSLVWLINAGGDTMSDFDSLTRAAMADDVVVDMRAIGAGILPFLPRDGRISTSVNTGAVSNGDWLYLVAFNATDAVAATEIGLSTLLQFNGGDTGVATLTFPGFSTAAVVPEPASFALLGSAVILLAVRRRRG